MKVVQKMVILLAFVGIVGCSSTQDGKLGDYKRCNATSAGKMAEIETGFFFAYNDFLYYADKTNMDEWVTVCNKPDCMHNDFDCNGYLLSYNQIIQKENRLYGVASSGEGLLLGIQTNVPFVYEIATDGSGTKKVYDIPVGDGNFVSGGSYATFHDRILTANHYLDEKGISHNQLVRVQEDENGEVVVDVLHESSGTFLMGANIYWGMRGEDAVITTIDLEEGTGMFQNLSYANRETLEKIPIPSDVNLLGAYLADDTLTYYQKGEGFYTLDISSGETTLLLEAQMEHGRGYRLTEDYFVEYSCYYEEGYEVKDVKVQFFDGEKWRTVVGADKIPNVKKGIVPVAVASDRIFFQYDADGETKTGLCYFMIQDKKPKFVNCSEIGKEVLLEEESSVSEEETYGEDVVVTEFDEVTILDNENGILKVTGGRQEANEYIVDLFWKIGESSKDYVIRVDAVINGVQCGLCGFFHTASEKQKQEKNGEYHYEIIFQANGNLDTCGISDLYRIDEFTDIALTFSLLDWNTQKEIKTETVHFYPKGENEVLYFTREPQETDVVLVDNESIQVIVTGYERNKIANDTVKLFVKNKTDQDMDIRIEAMSINYLKNNGEGADYFWQQSILAGASVFQTIKLADQSFLETYNIEQIGNVQLLLKCSNINIATYDKIGEDFIDKVVMLYPNGENQIQSYVREPEATDLILIDNDFIRLTLTGYKDSSFFWMNHFTVKNGTICLVIENKTEEVIGVAMNACSVNGILTGSDVVIEQLLPHDTYYYERNVVGADFFQEHNITDTSKIEFMYNIYDKKKEGIESTYIDLYPKGKEQVKLYEMDLTKAKEVVLDNEFVTATILGYEDSLTENTTYKNAEVLLVVQNKTSEAICYEIGQVVANGSTASEKLNEIEEENIVLANTMAIESIFTYRILLEEDMTELENIEFDFIVYSYDEEYMTKENVLGSTKVRHEVE